MTLPGFTAKHSLGRTIGSYGYYGHGESIAKVYHSVIRELFSRLAGEDDLIANLANTAAVLKTIPKFFWVGFYLVKGGELVLGPFQGTPACTRIAFGKGVCGFCAIQKKTIVVPDVHQFPGHIACDPNSRSEIVVPVFDAGGELRAVLDVDSTQLNAFSEVDKQYLEIIAGMLQDKF